MLPPAFDFQRFLREQSHLLAPPVGNHCVYNAKDGGDFTVMIVGGPNERSDYHVNETDEFFYQYKGGMVLKVVDDGAFRDIEIAEGSMFMLPANTPHSPCRFANSIGIVVERKRPEPSRAHTEPHLITEVDFHCVDLGTQLKPLIQDWQNNPDRRKCKDCGEVAAAK